MSRGDQQDAATVVPFAGDACIAAPAPKVRRFERQQQQQVELRARTKRIKRQLAFRAYQDVEDLEPWRKRACGVLERLCAPLPQQLQEYTAEGSSLDMSTDGCRTESVDEEIEHMINRRLEAEGLDLNNAEQVAQPTLQDAAELEVVAPIRQRTDVVAERAARIGTESGCLVEEGRKLAETKTGSGRTVACSFTTANRCAHYYVYYNVVSGDPHAKSHTLLASQPSGIGHLQRIATDDVIISVAVCNTMGHKEQEFDVRASQRLYELRDAFHFACDWMFEGPTRMKSACFLIDGVFYVDKRDRTALDYSKEIIEWMWATRGPGSLKKDHALSMDVRLCDIGPITFGAPCTYIHQGDVEHKIYFTNARVANPRWECQLGDAYPVLTFMRRYAKRQCYACWQNPAVWLLVGSSRCPHNPSYWCSQCFEQFYLDSEGVPVQPVDYKRFPYLHDDF